DNVIYTNFKKNNSKLIFSKKLPPVIRGIYNYSNIDVFHYGWLSYMMDAYEKELAGNNYDFIISSYGPPVMLLAAQMLSQKYKIPYIIDFRDIYIDEKDKGLHLFFKKRIQKKIIGSASAVLFSTEGMRDYFFTKCGDSLKGKKNCIVYNGIDTEMNVSGKLLNNDIIEKFKKIKQDNTLVLLHTGTLYKGQNINFFINGINRFNEIQEKKIALVFLGLSENNAFVPLNTPGLICLPKVNLVSAMELQLLADALVLPVWDGRYTGFSGKTMEYLASGNIVLSSPNPQDDMRYFFERSTNVTVLDSYEMFEKICSGIINKNISRKYVEDNSIFTRKYWISQLSLFLKELKEKT
ncbi:MAG: hypothetical protein ACXVDW_21675, partial [Bacteroidia bacterium]